MFWVSQNDEVVAEKNNDFEKLEMDVVDLEKSRDEVLVKLSHHINDSLKHGINKIMLTSMHKRLECQIEELKMENQAYVETNVRSEPDYDDLD